MKNALHYIYDPLCGWCYAAAPLLQDILSSPLRAQFAFEMHAGGLFQRMPLPAGKRAMIRQADARIAEITGQIFGEAYLDGLLAREDTIYDSLPPIAAILAAGAISPGSEPDMLHAVQNAHYRQGRAIVQENTLADLAQNLGLERESFTNQYQSILKDNILDHLDNTLRLMHEAGAHGFPAFVIQKGHRLERLAHERYYGNASAFTAMFADKFSSNPD